MAGGALGQRGGQGASQCGVSGALLLMVTSFSSPRSRRRRPHGGLLCGRAPDGHAAPGLLAALCLGVPAVQVRLRGAAPGRGCPLRGKSGRKGRCAPPLPGLCGVQWAGNPASFGPMVPRLSCDCGAPSPSLEGWAVQPPLPRLNTVASHFPPNEKGSGLGGGEVTQHHCQAPKPEQRAPDGPALHSSQCLDRLPFPSP